MKKLISYITALGFVLGFGIAYAGENATMAMERSDTPDNYVVLAMENGITIFDAAVLPESGAGRYAEAGEKELVNGVTIFATGPVSYDSGVMESRVEGAEGSAAGGLSAEGSGRKIENGITIFDTAPVDSN